MLLCIIIYLIVTSLYIHMLFLRSCLSLVSILNHFIYPYFPTNANFKYKIIVFLLSKGYPHRCTVKRCSLLQREVYYNGVCNSAGRTDKHRPLRTRKIGLWISLMSVACNKIVSNVDLIMVFIWIIYSTKINLTILLPNFIFWKVSPITLKTVVRLILFWIRFCLWSAVD